MSRDEPSRTRDLIELILGYGTIVAVIWTPEHLQRILSPLVLVLTLAVVLARRQSRDELGLGRHDLLPSLWILPAAIALAVVSSFVAAKFGTLHPLYKGDFAHISGYVLWTIYQQFLLQDYFMDRVLRLLSNETAAVVVPARSSPQRICPTSCSLPQRWCGESFHAHSSVATVISGQSVSHRGYSASASRCASRTRFITTCALVSAICAITGRGRFRENSWWLKVTE